MSDLQPDNRIGEARRSRFEGQAEHILGHIDVGVVTHPDGKSSQSFGLETACTH